MSHEDTNTSTHAQKTLTEAKKERKQYEQDAVLLNNRIKLLQMEEAKTWKQIEETKRKTGILENARKRNDEKQRARDELIKYQEKRREENQKKIQELKLQIEISMKKNKQSVEESKKNAYNEIKMMRDHNLRQLMSDNEQLYKNNQKRSTSVKVEHIKNSLRIKKAEKSKQNQAKADYYQKVNEEIQLKSQLEVKVSEMEALEAALIKKLQNTQSIQQKANSDLESLKR